VSTLEVRRLDGSAATLDRGDLSALAAGLRGEVIVPGDAAYDAARSVWNAMIDRRPALVARCVGTADVLHAVSFAREHGLELCIRAGGHNIAGLAVRDDALMIDLSLQRGVWVDRERRVARAQAGCTLGDVDRETQLSGLAAVLGFVSNTGIAGLTLGGGFGYLTRRFGWTSDNVRAFEIVTADGRLRRASETEEPELFWGLRGGGGNFGVVTGIEYDLHPIGPEIVGGAIAWRAEEAGEVLRMFREIQEEAPPEHVCVGAIRRAPPAPWLDEDVHGKLIVALFVCDTGRADEAQKRADRIRSCGSPVGDVLMPRPYVTQQALLDATQPSGRRYYWKSEYLPGIEEELLESVLSHARRIRSPHSAILLFPLDGKLGELPADHSAVGNRDAKAVLNVAASWEDAAEDDTHVGWAREAWEDLRRFSTGGTYVNFLTEEEGEDRVRAAYGENLDRLAAIKAEYDPQNLFRANQNVRPRRVAR